MSFRDNRLEKLRLPMPSRCDLGLGLQGHMTLICLTFAALLIIVTV
jgi:hypothetical protein